MSNFNLSEWALRHKSFVVFLMLVSAIAGVYSYGRLGREEDPPFTIKTMVVKTLWPGASTSDTIQQITDRIERKLEEVPNLDFVRSYTKAGESTIFVNLKDSVRASEVADLWYQVRKKVGDIRGQLPSGIAGPFFNDEFGDTYALIYAFTWDGFSPREVRDRIELIRSELLRVPGIAKADLVGAQDEKIFLEFSTKQLAALGIDINTLAQILQAQNAVAPSGVIDSGPERISIRVTGQFASEASLKTVNFRIGQRFFRLSDIAEIKRGYADPPQPMLKLNGRAAIGLALSMARNADAEALGRNVKARMAQLIAETPIGIDAELVADQPHIVSEAVGEFTKSLWEAIFIVLAVSFIALGWRPGIVVAISIPLVLAITFVVMEILGISLQRISLGALIIALGLLVDDAMIAVEMMITKLEEGYDRIKAATFAYTSTAFPMLTGTLVTVAGFVPVGFAQSGAGEYCFTMFVVIGVSLIVSWIVAVLFTPLTGVFILPETMSHKGKHEPSAIARQFRVWLSLALKHSKTVLAATAIIFVLSLLGMRFVQQQFFPASDRSELLVNLTLPQNSSLKATEEVVKRAEELFKKDPDIRYWTFYVGQGAVRFYLPLDAQLANDFFAQAVVVTKGYKERTGVLRRLEADLTKPEFDNAMARVAPLELGPPVGWPLKFRVSGPDIARTRELSHAFAQILGANTNTRNINFDWNEPAKTVRIDVDQDRARLLGISSQQLSSTINSILSGLTVTQVRDATYLVDIVMRAVPEERAKLETLRNLQIETSGGRSVPLAQIANIGYALEQPLVWRRQRVPTVTVQADVSPGVEPATVVKQVSSDIEAFRAKLPAGYSIAVGGSIEDSAKAQASIFAVFPLMLLLMAFILMIQLMSFQRLAIVMLTGPLAMIGVALALLVSRAPMGFVAILGIISLIGMVIRNSVILIDQVDQNITDGEEPWSAVVSATEHRLRPILLTAAAAILGMIPIAPTVFWGPMAYAVMGGLAVATILTLVFLPALYVTWFGLRAPRSPTGSGDRQPKQLVAAVSS